MKSKWHISSVLILLIVSLCLSAYQNNLETDLGPLYAPFINNKWEFYAIGDSAGSVAYHYNPADKYSHPVYMYFRDDKKLAAYNPNGILGGYSLIDTDHINFGISFQKNRMPAWAECLRDHGKANTKARYSKYSFTDRGLLIHVTIKGADSTLIFNKIRE